MRIETCAPAAARSAAGSVGVRGRTPPAKGSVGSIVINIWLSIGYVYGKQQQQHHHHYICFMVHGVNQPIYYNIYLAPRLYRLPSMIRITIPFNRDSLTRHYLFLRGYTRAYEAVREHTSKKAASWT